MIILILHREATRTTERNWTTADARWQCHLPSELVNRSVGRFRPAEGAADMAENIRRRCDAVARPTTTRWPTTVAMATVVDHRNASIMSVRRVVDGHRWAQTFRIVSNRRNNVRCLHEYYDIMMNYYCENNMSRRVMRDFRLIGLSNS